MTAHRSMGSQSAVQAHSLGSAPASPLAQLNAYIACASAAARDEGDGDTSRPRLRSAVRFGRAWQQWMAESRLERARLGAPQNAGPLNAQRLMVETLMSVADLSPAYVQRLLTQAEALFWLEDAQRLQPGGIRKTRERQASAPKRPRTGV